MIKNLPDDYALVISTGNRTATELIPLNVDETTCTEPIPDFGAPLVGAVGTVHNKRLKICGGYDPVSNRTSKVRDEM